MEINKKRFIVIWIGASVLGIIWMYFYYTEDDKNKDELVIPKNENFNYDNKLEESRKNQKQATISPTFTVADSIEHGGSVIENPVKTDQIKMKNDIEQTVRVNRQRQQQAITNITSSLQTIDQEDTEPITYYKPKGQKITYKNGKAYANGHELEEQQEEPKPEAFKNVEQKVADIKAGTPKSYTAGVYDLASGVISCVVHTTQVVKNGGSVLLRTTKETKVGALIIPRNTMLTATARYSNDRVSLSIKFMKIDGNFYTVNMVGLGDDGNEGLPLTSSVEMQVISNEVGNSIVSEASNVFNTLGVAGRAASSIARGVNSATRNQKQKEIKLITNQKINFVSYEN